MRQIILKIVLFLCVLTLFFSCKKENEKVYTDAEIEAESKKVNDFFQSSFNRGIDNYPEFQTRLGIKKDYGKLNDNSPAAAERDLKINKEELQWLIDSVNVDALSKDVLLSYKLFKQNTENSISDYKYRLYNYPVNQMFGAQSGKPAFLINMHRIDDVEDAKAYISRLNGFNKYFSQLINNLKARETIGILPPKFVYDKVVQDSENILVGQPFDNSIKESTLLKDFMKKMKKFDINEKTKKNDKMIEDVTLT